MHLSVAIITKNEEKNIRDCLESIKWADEIIIVDSYSTDKTIEICKEYTSKIYTHQWEGFGVQKNRAIQYCTSPWILCLDADERITPALADEIKKILTHKNPAKAYKIPRKSTYCGKIIKYSGWNPDYVLRLFQKDFGYFNNELVHESLVVNGKISYLNHPLIHFSFDNYEIVLQKMNFYSSEKAKMLFNKNHTSSFLKAIIKGLATFFKTYFIKLGILDGKEGFMLAFSNAQGSFYSYIKLWFLHKQKSLTRQ
jgi:glycosyltransferase involved in cell wall biosynthesis